MLDELWKKTHKELVYKAEMGGARECDKKMQQICQAIDNIPWEIRRYVLNSYLKQMEKLSWIGFYHKRKVEQKDNPNFDVDQVNYLIHNIQNWLKSDLKLMREKDLLTPEAI